jgi:glutathione S-transferase
VQRGLVPSLSYDGNILTESAIITQFLVDAHPSHLLPPPTTVSNALYRAQVALFIDTFVSKVVPLFKASVCAPALQEKDSAAEALANAVANDIEPLLVDGQGPFFGGSDRLTLVEAGLVCHIPRSVFR